jgi:hypothetical protein
MENLSFTLSTVSQKFGEDKANNLADPIDCMKYIPEHIFPIYGASFIVFENVKPSIMTSHPLKPLTLIN